MRTASGEVIDHIAWQEHFARTTDTRDFRIAGEPLRPAVTLLDQNQVTSLHGDYAGVGKVDEASLVFTIVPKNGAERTVTMKNCAETRVCSFFTAAVKQGIIDKLPGLCRNAGHCGGE